MKWYQIIFIFIVLLGAMNLAYQVFKMTELDARSRGFKHPKLWGLFATGGQNGAGLIVYLIGRRNYPSTMSIEDANCMASRKNKSAVSLVCIAIGAIGLVVVTLL